MRNFGIEAAFVVFFSCHFFEEHDIHVSCLSRLGLKTNPMCLDVAESVADVSLFKNRRFPR